MTGDDNEVKTHAEKIPSSNAPSDRTVINLKSDEHMPTDSDSDLNDEKEELIENKGTVQYK